MPVKYTLFSGYYIGLEQAGTSTTINMATDSTGGTQLVRCQVNSDGFFITDASAIFIPHAEETYKISLYPTLADSQAKTNAVWVLDNLSPIGDSGVTSNVFFAENYDTFALAVAAAAGKELVISTNLGIAANITVSGLTLRFIQGGNLDPNTTITATLNCDISAGNFEIFDATAAGTIAGNFAHKPINPMWFGAKIDGTAGALTGTDDFDAIQRADVAAGNAGVSLTFPDGISAISLQVSAPLTPTSSWYSKGGWTAQNINLTLTTDSEFIQVAAQTDLTFTRIHIDGQITTTGSGTPNLDQGTPSDSNVDDYTRCAGWNIKSSSFGITLIDCKAKNIYRSSFRAESDSEKITYINCRSNRNRGTFGDPFYSQVCRNVTYTSCRAEDYTRIGFVFEGSAPANDASDFCNITDCYAEYAHDNFSGENAAGFWLENAQEVNISGCHAVNTVGGYVLTATDSEGKAIANGGEFSQVRTYNLTNCDAISVKGGLSINPDDKNAIFNISNFNASIPDKTAAEFNGTATQFFFDVIGIKAGVNDFVVNITNCGGYVDNTNYLAALTYGFIGILQDADTTTQKILNIQNCAVQFADPAKVRTDATSNQGSGFFHGIGSIGVKAQISDCHEIGGADDGMTVHITTYDDKGEFFFRNCRPQVIDWAGRCDKIVFDDCDFIDIDVQIQANEVKVFDSFFNVLNFKSNDVKLSTCTGQNVSMTTVDPHGRYDGFTARNCNFNGNLNTGDTLSFTVADVREWRANFNGCVFHDANKGVSTGFHFIVIDRAEGFVTGSGNIFDASITNYMERNGADFSDPRADVTDSSLVAWDFGMFQAIDA